MKRNKIKMTLVTALYFIFHASVLSAQTIPSDGLFPGTNGTWANDTIIKSNNPITGTTPHSPVRISITAIYRHGYILVTSTSENVFTYSICDSQHYTYIQGRESISSSSPALINLTTLPTGHYTLLIYINNECLEGEFEKE